MWVAVSFLYPHLDRSVSRRGSRALIQNFFPKEGGGGGGGGVGWGVNIHANQTSKHYDLKTRLEQKCFQGLGRVHHPSVLDYLFRRGSTFNTLICLGHPQY